MSFARENQLRILLAHDLSPDSERAAELVARARWPAGSAIRVVTSPSGLGAPLSSFASPSAALAHAELTRDVILAEQARIATELEGAGLAVEAAVVPGRPGEAVVGEALEFDADLVVTGARRDGPLTSAVLGSVSAEIAERSRCSVLVARTARFERVLVATDGSAPAGAAVAAVAAWPMFETAEVQVVGVVDPAREYAGVALSDTELGDSYATSRAGATHDAEGFIEAAVAELTRADRAVAAELRTGDPRSEVIAAANDGAADLVVVGVNGEPLLRRLLLGSVARSILGGVPASVLVVRPPLSVIGEAAGDR